MSKTARQRIAEINAYYKQQNAEFLGTTVSLSVTMGQDTVPLSTIQSMVRNTPEIPDKWMPDPRNKLTLYLETINQLKNSASFERFRKHEDEFPFDPAEHFGYLGKRTRYKRDEEIPVAHKIVHLRRSDAVAEGFEDMDIDMIDYDVDDGIVVMLRRTEGTEDTDDSTSRFAIEFPGNLPDEYMPFILTLNETFAERLAQNYDSTAIREVILDMVKGKMNAQPINTGLYLVEGEQAHQLDALRHEFRKIHPSIDLFTQHVVRHNEVPEEHPANQNFQNVKRRLTSSVVEDMKSFVQELEQFEESDTDTKRSTWTRRANALREMKKRVRKFKNKAMLETAAVEKLLGKATETITEQLKAG